MTVFFCKEQSGVDKDYRHWVSVQGACDTREMALVRDGVSVVTDPSTCKVTSGSWVDPYSGETFTDAKKMDIDHLIPLQYAHQHGGASWDAGRSRRTRTIWIRCW